MKPFILRRMEQISEELDARPALREYFGFDDFRDGQEEVVRLAVAGQDTLALMPTGAGKSLCYQLAAMLRPSPTLVISPLIALMKDQVDNLPSAIAAHTCLINSSLSGEQVDEAVRGVQQGKYRLIYVAPERLRRRNFIAALQSAGIGLAVIDEVHCVSMWGHDFRPDYLFIRQALGALGDPAVLGVTATAAPETVDGIASGLGRELHVVRASVVRPNLRYDVRDVSNEEDRRRATVDAAARGGSGIVYARSREKCEKVAQMLRNQGIKAAHYHAGLNPDERARVQEAFLRDRVQVIVATTAFGMGIDKPDIRWVLLYDFPSSIEDYVQRVGRAGRDGQPAVCTLLAGTVDGQSLRRFARADVPTVTQLRRVYREVRSRAEDDAASIGASELSEAAELEDGTDPRVLLGMLEQAGLLQRTFDAGAEMRVDLLPAPPDAAQRIEYLLRQYAQGSASRAERMIRFAEREVCRHQQVAEHFGERLDEPCGRCDICDPPPWRHLTAPDARPLPDNIARAIVDAAGSVHWPLGTAGLTAMLKGSVGAPPSARRSSQYGLLEAAPESRIKRWIGELVEKGNLEHYQEGEYRLLRVRNKRDLPVFERPDPPARRGAAHRPRTGSEIEIEPPAGPLQGTDALIFESLRAWRRERAQQADVPAYIILADRVLREIARLRPAGERDLARIKGMGPAKIKEYGQDIVSAVRDAGLQAE